MSSTGVNLQMSTFGVKKKMKKKSVVVASSRNGDRVLCPRIKSFNVRRRRFELPNTYA